MIHHEKVNKKGKKCFCDACTVDYFKALHIIRATGKINMYGAGVPLREMFPELSRDESHEVLELWMNSFKK